MFSHDDGDHIGLRADVFKSPSPRVTCRNCVVNYSEQISWNRKVVEGGERSVLLSPWARGPHGAPVGHAAGCVFMRLGRVGFTANFRRMSACVPRIVLNLHSPLLLHEPIAARLYTY